MTELLELAVNAAGGHEAWSKVSTITARVSLTGGLYAIKRQPAGMPDVSLKMRVDNPEVEVSPFPEVGQVGHFQTDRVWVSDAKNTTVSELRDPRDSFAGATLTTPWEPLQLLYFNAYAMWNYLSTPFLLTRPGFHTQEVGPHEEMGQSWRVLEVTYPDNIPFHTKTQRLYFNEQGLLQRLDYSTDVAGGVASHYCFDHKPFQGITLPTLRRVVARRESGPTIFGPTAVLLRISNVTFE